MTDRPARITQARATAILLTALCLAYLPMVGHGFVKDDVVWIARSGLADVGMWWRGAPTGFFRPVVSLSFGLNRFACGVGHSWCYGATNFALLLACAAGVFALARALSLSLAASLAAAALWAFNWNGINMAVLWISGRTSLLLVLFATAGAAAFLRGRWMLAALLIFASMLSKEEALPLPFVLVGWAVWDGWLARQDKRAGLLGFAAAAGLLTAVYLLLRLGSGAFTPATAPSYYRLEFSAARLIENLPRYLDRSATFSASVLFLFWCFFVRGRWQLARESRRAMVFAACWIAGGMAITLFLPVRSNLYALLPSIGVALLAARLLSDRWIELPARPARHALLAGLILPFALLPLYWARNLPSVQEARLSTRTLTALRAVAADHRPGTTVRLNDDRSARPSLDDAFGTLLQEAVNLTVTPGLTVWIDPPPKDVDPGSVDRSRQPDVTLTLAGGTFTAR